MPAEVSFLESHVAAHNVEHSSVEQHAKSTAENVRERRISCTQKATSVSGQSDVMKVDLQSILFFIDVSRDETKTSASVTERTNDDVDDVTSEADSGLVSGLDLTDSCFSSDDDEQDSASESSNSCHSSPTDKADILPRRKKVSFADEIGLELESVQIYEPVNRSQHNTEWYNTDVCSNDNSDPVAKLQPWWLATNFRSCSNKGAIFVEQHFPAPWSNPSSLISRLQNQSVVLETITSTSQVPAESDALLPCLNGTILVVNLAYDKRVYVRCTFDGWKTYRNVSAAYVGRGPVRLPFKCQQQYLAAAGCTDLFAFDLAAVCDPQSLSRCRGNQSTWSNAVETVAVTEFAVCYEARFGDRWRAMWDNNDGKNYRLSYIRRY